MDLTQQYYISPKPFAAFGIDEFQNYVADMEIRPAKTKAESSPAPGLTISRTKAGKLSIRRAKSRPFAYITHAELTALAAGAKCSQAELWNTLRSREFILAKSRMEAETIYARLKEIPF